LSRPLSTGESGTDPERLGGRHGKRAWSPPAHLSPDEKGNTPAGRGPGGVAALRQHHWWHPGSTRMKELMVPVERAVRPVHANPARKRRMRQELLAHLTAIFEEERAHGSDEQLALAQALRRFGNPADLVRDLQASVPFLERWEGQMLSQFLPRPGERRLRHALRLAALVAAFVLGALLLFPLVRVAAGDDWSHARVGLACLGVVTGYAFLSVLVG